LQVWLPPRRQMLTAASSLPPTGPTAGRTWKRGSMNSRAAAAG
jgi:hypothetical protein